jgi:hypothetical protein
MWPSLSRIVAICHTPVTAALEPIRFDGRGRLNPSSEFFCSVAPRHYVFVDFEPKRESGRIEELARSSTRRLRGYFAAGDTNVGFTPSTGEDPVGRGSFSPHFHGGKRSILASLCARRAQSSRTCRTLPDEIFEVAAVIESHLREGRSVSTDGFEPAECVVRVRAIGNADGEIDAKR